MDMVKVSSLRELSWWRTKIRSGAGCERTRNHVGRSGEDPEKDLPIFQAGCVCSGGYDPRDR